MLKEKVDLRLSMSSSGSVTANVKFGRQLSRQLSRKSIVSSGTLQLFKATIIA